MGLCTSKTKDAEESAAPQSVFDANGAKTGGAQPSKPPAKGAAEPQSQPDAPPQPSGVQVEFDTDEKGMDRSQSLGNRWSRNASLQSEASKQGSLGPTGVYVPSSGFKTPDLVKRMSAKYDMPEAEVEKAIDFAESEEFVDVYCFTYCITGGPMEPTAFKVAGLQGMDKEAILQWATAAGNEDVRVLNAEEQLRAKRAREDFLVSIALQPEQEEENGQPEDLEELMEAYRIRFDADTQHMSLEEVMEYFGVPEISKVAIHKHLHPAKGSATATTDEIARRKAAHPIALERFDALS